MPRKTTNSLSPLTPRFDAEGRDPDGAHAIGTEPIDAPTRARLEVLARAFRDKDHDPALVPSPRDLELMRRELVRIDSDDGREFRSWQSPVFRCGAFLGAIRRERERLAARAKADAAIAEARARADAAATTTTPRADQATTTEQAARRAAAELERLQGQISDAQHVAASNARLGDYIDAIERGDRRRARAISRDEDRAVAAHRARRVGKRA